jgi:alpha-L-fucosidase 2
VSVVVILSWIKLLPITQNLPNPVIGVDIVFIFLLAITPFNNFIIGSAKNNGTIELNVKVKDGVLTGTAMVRLITKGGKVSISQNKLHIEKADQATIYLVAATSFINPKDVSGKPGLLCNQYLSKLGAKKFECVKQKHLKDYQFYFNRFSIDLGHSASENNPTDTRLKEMQTAMDLSLSALYVQYARYLMLSSSRPGTYPANLQGIWNNKTNPPWDSKYTVNINTEMN